MIELFQFPGLNKSLSMSPFCTKVELYLKMTGLPYKNHFIMDPRPGPKGKAPYIVVGDLRIGVSHLIIQYLKKKYGDSLDAHLSPVERATALAFQRLMEEDLYWALLYARWGDENGYAKMKEIIGKNLPFFLRSFIMGKIRKNLLRQGYGHGMMRHSADEIYARGIENLTAVRDFLGTKKYMMGDRPCSLDATAFGFLQAIKDSLVPNVYQTFVSSHGNLSAYCDRLKADYFS